MRGGAHAVFIGAHPDDEALVGPLLAFAADHSRASLLCVTAGHSGWNFLPTDTTRTLAQVRSAELEKACAILGITCRGLGYANGMSKAHPEGLAVHDDEVTSDLRWKTSAEFSETPEEVIARWTAEKGDPLPVVRKFLSEAAPGIAITFEPDQGYTGHNEHRAVSLLVNRAAAGLPGLTLYHMIKPADRAGGDIEIVSSSLSAGGKRDYVKVGMEAEMAHVSQWGAPGTAEYGKYYPRLLQRMQTMVLREAGTKMAQ